MIKDEKAVQARVGFFMMIGLVIVALMVVYFGRLGEGVLSYYKLRVEYPNASGLLRGSEVLMAGAKIGRVINSPTILPDLQGVYVELKIVDTVKIPEGSEFGIGSSGLLGDRFVQIILQKNALEAAPISPGATIKGKGEAGGIAEMSEQAGQLIGDLRETVGNINSITKKIDSLVLDKKGLGDMTDILGNLKTTTESFAQTSKKIDIVITHADDTIKGGKQATEELQKTMADIRSLVNDTKKGKGTIGMLLTNQEVADNIRSLAANLRRYGIIWYKDGTKGKPPER